MTGSLAARRRSPSQDAAGLEGAIPIGGTRGDYDALLQLVGDRRFVLLGEASHGSHGF